MTLSPHSAFNAAALVVDDTVALLIQTNPWNGMRNDDRIKTVSQSEFEMKNSSSRWDGLYDNKRSHNHHSSRHSRQRDGKYLQHDVRIASVTRPERTNGSWRAFQNASANLTTEEEKIRNAVKSLEAKVTSYGKNIGVSSENESDQKDIANALDELSTLFSVNRQEINTRSQSSASLFVVWEAADSIIHILKLLKPSMCYNLLTRISKSSVAFLQMTCDCIQDPADAFSNASFQRPRSMTDLRICECASIILECLGDEEQHLDHAGEPNDYKISLFQGLAKILSLSMILGFRDSITKNRRSILFPWGAEKTVNLVVMQSILPFVEKIMADVSMSTFTKLKYCFPAIECLHLLLRDSSTDTMIRNYQPSKHAIAILAPLIIDVDPSGQEKERPNPLRPGTLKAITIFWNRSIQLAQDHQPSPSINEIQNEINIGSQCLISALNALHALKRGKMPHSGEVPPVEIDVATICRQVHCALQIEKFSHSQSMFLRLLASLCQTYPGVAARQWYLFIEQPMPQLRKDKTSSNPLLLKFVQDGAVTIRETSFNGTSTSLLSDALQSTLMLVSAMPFLHWISEESTSKTRSGGENYFGSRVRHAMIRVIESTHILMESIRCIVTDVESVDKRAVLSTQSIYSITFHTSQLAAKLCSTLPFSDRNLEMLLPASKLVRCAGEIYVLCVKAMDDPSQKCAQFYEKTADDFINVITGTVDIESNQTLTPSQHWLSDSASFELIGRLLSQGSTFQSKSMSVLCRIARICPWALVREPFNLASFCELCTTQSNARNSPERRLSGVRLIESFLLGRRIFATEFDSSDMSTTIVHALCPIIFGALKDKEAKVRAAAVTSFGHVSEAEWCILLDAQNNKRFNDWQSYVDAIFQLCSKTKGEKSAKVRSAACKAIGEICTCVMDSSCCSRKLVLAFSQNMCNKMENTLKDECSSVRSMGIFAFGNMALSLKEHHSELDTILPLLPRLHRTFITTIALLDDKDEKVVTNAIRAVGHLSYFIYSSKYSAIPEQYDSHKMVYYNSLMTNLISKVKCAADHVTEGTSINLSSNQRNNAKKHAWGSCSTLGSLLRYSQLMQNDSPIVESALFEQFRCLQLSSVIHEKIAAAAVHCLAGLPDSFWQSLPDGCDSIGRGLASCLCYLSNLSKQKTPLPSYHETVKILTNTLLYAAKANDFKSAFVLSDTVPFSIDFFYQWLVSNNVNIQVMEEILVAVQYDEVQQFVDVSSVQMFTSRSKEMNSPLKSTADENDDEDEI